MLEKIMEEIRNELKRSNDLKEKQLQDFTNTAEEAPGWTKLPAEEQEEPKDEKEPAKEEPKKEEPAKEEPKKEAPATADAPDEATFKKSIAKVIKGGTKEQKDKVKSLIKKTGAEKVSDVPPQKRQEIMEYTEALHWLD
ncbi:hypothetical protein [Staphylococcus cohnii]